MQKIVQWILFTILFLSPLAFCPYSYDSFELPKLLLIRFLMLVALIAILINKQGFTISLSHLHLPILVLFITDILATTFSVSQSISFNGTYQRYNGLLLSADMIMLFFLATLSFSPSSFGFLFPMITITASLMSIYGIFQHFGMDFAQWNISESAGTSALSYRSFATLANPSFLGLYLAMSLPLCSVGMITTNKRKMHILYGAGLALIAPCLIWTYSRASWLGAFIGVSIMLILCRQKVSKLWIAVFVCALLICIIISSVGNSPSAIDRLASSADDSSIQIRLKLWNGSIKMILARPITGWGLDTFRFIFPRFAVNGMSDLQRRNVSAHNDFLDRTAQTGILGLMAYIWLLITLFLLIRKYRYIHKIEITAIISAIIAYLIAVQFGFSSIAPKVLLWILIGCIDDSSMFRPKKLSLKASKITISILVLIWLIISGWTMALFIADLHFHRAEIAWQKGLRLISVKEIEKALRWNSKNDFYMVRLGQFQEEQGKDGMSYYLSAVKANPLNSANHALLATALQKRNNDKEAIQEWNNAVSLDPMWSQAHNALGLLYQKNGDYQSAIQSYSKAIDIDPEYAFAYNNLGNVYMAKGDIDKAIDSYKYALSLKPNWRIAKDNLDIATKTRDKQY